MNLDFEQLKSITLGVSYMEETEDGIIFHRFSKGEEDAYRKFKTESAYARVTFCSGVRFSFTTDSESLYMKGKMRTVLSKRFFYTFDLLVDGVLVDTITNVPDGFDPHTPLAELPVGEFEKTFSLGAGEKKVEVYFPWGSMVFLKEVVLDDGAKFTPVRYDKKLLCFGDSITQGYDALNPTRTYASILARALNAEIINKAIGGEVFFPELAAAEDDVKPDYITVAYGTNDFSKKDPETFRKNCRAFYENLCRHYPGAKIFAISPIYRKAYKDHPTTQFADFFDVEKQIKAVAESLPNVTFIPGFDLIPHDNELLSDRSTHPTNEGFEYYGKNLSEIILSYIK